MLRGLSPDVISRLISATEHRCDPRRRSYCHEGWQTHAVQSVLRRFRRRHDIAEAQGAIEMVPVVFDILYLDGETLIELPLSERRKRLESAVTLDLAPRWSAATFRRLNGPIKPP